MQGSHSSVQNCSPRSYAGELPAEQIRAIVIRNLELETLASIA